jgi:hypothetical protein
MVTVTRDASVVRTNLEAMRDAQLDVVQASSESILRL